MGNLQSFNVQHGICFLAYKCIGKSGNGTTGSSVVFLVRLLLVISKHIPMIEILTDVPANVAGFRAVGEVTKDDFKTVVLPIVDEVVIRTGELNYLMIIDTELKNWTAGAWVQDAMLGIQELTKWNRAAIVTDSEALNTFVDIFSVLVPGEFKGFLVEELPQAVRWVSTGEE